MDSNQIQLLCQRGQDQLSRMEYLAAEASLAEAEQLAWTARDFDALARLYMPLQEARRQRRQGCAEGRIRLDILAGGPNRQPDARSVVQETGQGQILVGGWGSIHPALEARRAQGELGLYVDVFLAAVYPGEAGRIVVIVPVRGAALPPPEPMATGELIRRLPAHSVAMFAAELPKGSMAHAQAWVMAMWRRLHAPYLAAAQAQADPIRRIEALRQAIVVDYACELAHQKISDTARKLCAKGTS